MSPAPSRRLGRPPSVDSAETRDQILQAARRAFAMRGFDATTNKEVAKAVGITTGAIYHYFGSKVELYAAVYEEVQEIVYGEFEKAVTEQSTFVERFCSVLDSAVAVNRQDPSIAGFVVGVATEAQRHPQLAPLVEPYRRRGRVFLNRLVEDAAANGELQPGVDPRAVLDMISAVLGGLATFSTTSGDAERHRAATQLVERMLKGTLLRE